MTRIFLEYISSWSQMILIQGIFCSIFHHLIKNLAKMATQEDSEDGFLLFFFHSCSMAIGPYGIPTSLASCLRMNAKSWGPLWHILPEEKETPAFEEFYRHPVMMLGINIYQTPLGRSFMRCWIAGLAGWPQLATQKKNQFKPDIISLNKFSPTSLSLSVNMNGDLQI